MDFKNRLLQSKYEIVRKKSYCIEREKLTVDFLFDFYFKTERHDIVLKIYENSKFIAAWDISNSVECQYNSTIDYYLDNLIYKGEIDTNEEYLDLEYIDQLFLCFYKTRSIHLKQEKKEFEEYLVEKATTENELLIRNNLIGLLRNSNIKCFSIGIPGEFVVGNIGFSVSYKLFWIKEREREVSKIIHNFTDLSYLEVKNNFAENDAKVSEKNEPVIMNKPKIYLVGPCIVDGFINLENEELIDLLREKVMDYEIVKIIEYHEHADCYSKILEHDIHENDLVIFINDIYNKDSVDIDMENIFVKSLSEKWLYTDAMIHTTKYGNELVVDEIVDKIILPIRKNEENVYSKTILHHKENQWITGDFIWKVRQYIEDIRMKGNNLGNDIGSIVMNANPFTKGHLYLTEYAASQVDCLYVFVVEEDLSEIPFKARFQMVKEGLKHLKNVIVVGSGRFIISKETFNGYFQKETIDVIDVDVTKDLEIFCRMIAKSLGIKKRFVGEEPLDAVTNKYNEMMKLTLPKYDIELIEIPRKELGDKVISATLVRSYYREKEWSLMKELVPDSTFQFLYKNQNKVELLRNLDRNIFRENQFEELHRWMLNHKNVVVYGIGQNADFLYSIMPESIMETVRFCDKKAKFEVLYYKDKRVFVPEELLSEDYILITSTKYGQEIYEELRELGIKKEHLYNLSLSILK